MGVHLENIFIGMLDFFFCKWGMGCMKVFRCSDNVWTAGRACLVGHQVSSGRSRCWEAALTQLSRSWLTSSLWPPFLTMLRRFRQAAGLAPSWCLWTLSRSLLRGVAILQSPWLSSWLPGNWWPELKCFKSQAGFLPKVSWAAWINNLEKGSENPKCRKAGQKGCRKVHSPHQSAELTLNRYLGN